MRTGAIKVRKKKNLNLNIKYNNSNVLKSDSSFSGSHSSAFSSMRMSV